MNENLNIYYVYCLKHPDTNKIFYIGKGKGYRMNKHESDVRCGRFPNNNYFLYKEIKSILNNNKNIIYEKIAENLTNDEAILLEKNKIEETGLQNLSNICPGGEGSDNFTYNPNKEIIREKMSNVQKKSYIEKYGEKRANEIIQKRLKSMKGYKHTENTKYKIKKSNTGKKFTIERRKNIGLSKIGNKNMLGKKHTDESKEKMRISHTGKIFSELHKMRISQSGKGKKRSKEFSENVSKRMLMNPPTKRIEVRRKISNSLIGRTASNKLIYILIKTPSGESIEFNSRVLVYEYFIILSDKMGLINNNRISGHQIIFKGESKGYILLTKELKGKIIIPSESAENDEKSK